ncbi:hypothetical protein ACWT_2082 [Actinoplanes sp. SE50]|uniref:DUF2079 domain-containing protein n=1 Tax=unclassified Actinoplanes TaxID=2626549 RepID=UPI00023EC766|nr:MULTISPECIES: DUF2079 domain-containing protein [unclassified Actinoplanes]AEV83101.1 hypothetical protein ACPL_2204 [Actinoplanes sp. SE50/110]ATO81497.1 hypothetical protein ACWT_2082 [Actinoplanes sp. SE50]SLL98904.1 hypothetical protein ACSP50_2131 [Actinoplanes sp. SE50/110]
MIVLSHDVVPAARATPVRRSGAVLAWSGAGGLAVIYLLLSLLNHRRLRTTGFDLGIFEQAVRSYAAGRPGLVPLKGPGFPQLGDHFSPVLALLAPLYRIFPTPVTLLVAQALLLAVAVVPIMSLAHRRLGAFAAVTAGAGYGLSWGIASAVGFDFHEVCFAVPLLSFSLAALADRRLRAASGWALPLLLVKEDLGLTVAVIGLLVAAFGARRLGGGLAAAGLLGTALAMGVVVPALNPDDAYAYSAAVGSGLQHPVTAVKLLTVLALLAPTAGVALRSPLAWVAVPTLLWRFASGNPNYWGTGFHYSAVLMPVMMLAFVDGLTRRRPAADRTGAAATRLVLVASLAVTGFLLPRYPLAQLASAPIWRGDPRGTAAHRVLDLIPDGATVSAANRLVPQLTGRTTVTLFGLDYPGPAPRYVVVDLEVDDWPLPRDIRLARVEALVAAGYRTVTRDSGFVLLERP